MKRFEIVLVLILLLCLFAGVLAVHAQDVTPEPVPVATEEPPVVTTTTTTTTASNPVQDIGVTLTWAIAFIALWQAAGIAYAVTVEKTVKPVLFSIINQFTQVEAVRSGILIVAVFVGAFYVVQTGGINLFADAPFDLFKNAPASFMLVLNSLFVATGAFMGHEIWDTLESWLKKAKAVNTVVFAPAETRADAQQSPLL